MNKTVVGDGDARIVIDDKGNVDCFSVDNVGTSNEDCEANKIFSLENDIEQLEEHLKEQEELLKK